MMRRWKEAYLLFTCIVMLVAGCGPKWTDGNRELDEAGNIPGEGGLSAVMETEEAKSGQMGDQEATGDVMETEKPEDEVSYPMIAEVSLATWEDVVSVWEGIYCIYKADSGMYGFISETGEEITPFCYEDAYPFYEGMACVCLEGKYGYIGPDGETLLPFVYDRAAPFSEGLAYFVTGDEYGFMDKTGKPVFYFDCESISSFRQGRAYFFKDGKYGYIDKNGKVAIEPAYDDAGYFENGAAIVRMGGFYGVIGLNGEEILPPVYEDIRVDDTFLITTKDGLEGCFNLSGEQCLSNDYQWIEARDGYLIFAMEDGKRGVADKAGSVVVPPMYESIYKVPGYELVVVTYNDEDMLLDFHGEKVSLPECDSIRVGDASDGRLIVSWNGKEGVAGPDGELLVPIEYDSIWIFEKGEMSLKQDGRMLLYDGSGQQVPIPENLSSVWPYGACYKGTFEGKYTDVLFDSEGNQVMYVDYFSVRGSDHVLLLEDSTDWDSNTYLAKVGPTEDRESQILNMVLVNEITPDSGSFYTHLLEGTFDWEMPIREDGKGMARSFGGCRRTGRLYGLDGSAGTYLYVYVQYLGWSNSRLANSAFFVSDGTECRELVRGYECGGTALGDRACLWFDGEQVYFGVRYAVGGFPGTFYGRITYVERGGTADAVCSWAYYADSEKEEYTVNGEETDAARFEEIESRYRSLDMFSGIGLE